ncbi:MAG: SBBP repeat-containing protein [Anaerolineales bacterium]|uniref:SBBP repeat-containing protein n=1 Tax=Candidatus Villigracilis proximus TaxID=3140683 RepID=UPI0031369320|nr:SBBP repeat-containing protein [Anaerolineales bacterium]
MAGFSTATWGAPVRGMAYSASNDAFAAQLNSSGVLCWNTPYLRRQRSDRGDSIAVDGSGNVYVAGTPGNATWGAPWAYSGGDERLRRPIELVRRAAMEHLPRRQRD